MGECPAAVRLEEVYRPLHPLALGETGSGIKAGDLGEVVLHSQPLKP